MTKEFDRIKEIQDSAAREGRDFTSSEIRELEGLAEDWEERIEKEREKMMAAMKQRKGCRFL